MKIVHLCLSSSFIDGYSYQENILPKYHVKLGHDVTLIASTESITSSGKTSFDAPVGIHFENGYKVIRIAYKKGFMYKIWRRLRIYSDISRLLDEEKPDIIFSHGVQFWDAFKVTDYVKKHFKVALFCDNHADYINSSRNFISKYILHKVIWRLTSQNLCKYSVKCYGVTPMRCDYLKDMYGLPDEKIEFLPMGIDDDAIPHDRIITRNVIRDSLGISNDDFVIITGGKIDKLKNIHHLLSAFKMLKRQNLHLVVFGIVMFQMQSIIDEYKGNSHIHFVGWCDAKQVMDYMIASDLCCFPGTHSTLWEQAIGIGLPTIFKNWGNGFSHLNVNGNCAFIEGENEEEIARVINMFLDKKFYKMKLYLSNEARKRFLYSEIAKKAICVN